MRHVETTVLIKSNPEQIIAAFTDQEKLKGWWEVERSLVEKRPGGVYSLAWQISEKGFGYISTGIVTSCIADKELKIENFLYFNPDRPILGPMTLHLLAKKKEGGTELYLCQGGYQYGTHWDWYYEAVSKAWPIAVKNLKAYLESK